MAAVRLRDPEIGRGAKVTTLTVTSIGTFLALAAFTFPLADLPTLAVEFGAGPTAQAWILSSMSVGLAGAMLLTGTLADEFGRRRVFVAGSAVLAVGSLACVIAPTAALFVAARIVQGVGAAAVVAASLALVGVAYPKPAERAVAASVWGATLGAGIAIGPLVVATSNSSGHWWAAYAALGLFSAVLTIGGHRLLRESRSPDRRRPDLTGATAFTAAMVLLLTGMVAVRQADGATVSVALIGLAVVILAAFVALELRRTHPMLDPRLFGGGRFTAATLGAFVTGIGVIGLMSIASVYLIDGVGFGVFETAWAIFLWSAVSVVTALLASKLPDALRGPRQLAIGLIGAAFAQLLTLSATSGSGPSARLRGPRDLLRHPQRGPRRRGGGERAGGTRRLGQRRQQHRALPWFGDRGDDHRAVAARRARPGRRLESRGAGHGGMLRRRRIGGRVRRASRLS